MRPKESDPYEVWEAYADRRLFWSTLSLAVGILVVLALVILFVFKLVGPS